MYLFSPHCQTDLPALPSIAPVPELYDTPRCLVVNLGRWGPLWTWEACVLLGWTVAVWYL